jgi:hypothetical protein
LCENEEKHEIPLREIGLGFWEFEKGHVRHIEPVIVDENIPHEHNGVWEIVEIHLLVVMGEWLILDFLELLWGF